MNAYYNHIQSVHSTHAAYRISFKSHIHTRHSAEGHGLKLNSNHTLPTNAILRKHNYENESCWKIFLKALIALYVH